MIGQAIKEQSDARERRREALEKNKDAVAALQFDTMVVMARIIGDWEQGDLKPSEALVKIGLAKAKHKRLLTKIVEE